MKLFINRSWILLLGVIFLAACSKPQEQAAAVAEELETVLVEETVLPPTAEKPRPVQAPSPAPRVQQTPSLAQALVNVQAWDKKLKFLKTQFEQTTQYDGVPVSKAQGTLYYDRDKHMLRLDTADSDGKTEQSALTDKNQILILDGQGNEITTLSWKEWQQGQPNQALFDFGNYTELLQRHQVELTQPYELALTPKEGEKYTLYLTLSDEDYFPVAIKIVSDLMVTEAKLFHTQKNQPLAFDTFRAGGLFR